MIRYAFTKLWQSALTLLLASIVVFIGVRMLPGDPARAMAGEDASPEQLAAMREQLGLNASLPHQFLTYLGNLLSGDLGNSTRTGTPVVEMIAATLPVTLWLSAYAIAIAVIVGVLFGVIAERFRGRWPEWFTNGFALIGLSVPNFWLGILAILYLAVSLGWFPASGYVDILSDPLKGLYYLTLPAIILGTSLAAVIMRQTRASMIETMSTDYVRTAKAKGQWWPGAAAVWPAQFTHRGRDNSWPAIGRTDFRGCCHRAHLRLARLRKTHTRCGVYPGLSGH